MRISDWSSDVCSSDLRKGFGNLGPCYTAASDDDFLTARGRLRFGRSFSSRSLFLRRRVLRNDHSNQRCGGENLLPVAKICAVRHAMSPVFEDRKSVVSGKSVSVRVDLGVRRIIKKKKKT